MGIRRSVRLVLAAALLALPVWSSTPVAANHQATDVSVTKTDSPDPVTVGADLTYTITVSNANSDSSTDTITLTDPLPAGTTFVSMTGVFPYASSSSTAPGAPCTTPSPGQSGTVTCVGAVGCSDNCVGGAASASATFTLVVKVASFPPGGTLTNTATATLQDDPDHSNNSGIATTTVNLGCTIDRRSATSGQTINGTSGPDVICGSPFADEIIGRGGNDRVYGFEGADDISGNDGNDTLFGGAGDDEIFGGAGNDTMSGEGGEDDLRGGTGTDSADGGPGPDECSAESEVSC